jgi:hypothetical protein
VDPPADLSTEATTDTSSVIFFVEALAETLAAPMPIDVHMPGEVQTFDALPGSLATGTVVNSYLFHYDIEGTTPTVEPVFMLTFPDEILGLQVTSDSLNAGTAALGLASVNYHTDAGLENGSGDRVELSADRRTLTVTLAVGTAVDRIRVLTSGAAGQSVLITSGAVELTNAPLDVTEGGTESNTAFQLFMEQQGTTLAANLLVDAVDPGTYVDASELTTTSVARESVVTCYLLHFDPVDITNDVTLQGGITFPTEILAVAVLDATLNGSDSLGVGTTTYPNASRQLELSPTATGDTFTLGTDGRSLAVHLRATTAIDQMRILLAQ